MRKGFTLKQSFLLIALSVVLLGFVLPITSAFGETHYIGVSNFVNDSGIAKIDLIEHTNNSTYGCYSRQAGDSCYFENVVLRVDSIIRNGPYKVATFSITNPMGSFNRV